jgi:hypothetical protein
VTPPPPPVVVPEAETPIPFPDIPIGIFDDLGFFGIGPFGAMDPIAQTFYVDGMPFGCYTTELDVFFRTKSATAPITLQIREVVNGYPGDKVIPFGEVTLNPNQVNVSETAATATKFTFPSPVHLQNNTEYCFVLLPAGNDPNYNIWVSEIGENELGTEDRISEQPNIGVLFTSANNRSWTAYQKEDIKFTLYRADFAINTVGTVVMKNLNIDYMRFESFSDGFYRAGDTVHGFTFDIINAGSDYTDGTISQSLTGGGGTGATVDITISGGAVTNVVITNLGTGYTSNPTLTVVSGSGTAASVSVTLNKGIVKQYDSLYNVGKILVTDGSFNTGDIVSNDASNGIVAEIENKQLNVLETNIGSIDHTPATISWSVAPTATGASTAGSTFEGYSFGQEYDLSYEAQVYSYSNEQNFSGTGDKKSLTIRAGMSTQTSTVSPVIDTRKCSIIAIANDINNDTTDEDTNNGFARSKYISRRVVLDDGQDAEDLKVYLSNQIPAGCNVKVYGKFQNATDASNFDDLEWIELEPNTVPLSSTARSGFVEYDYVIPDANKNAGVLEYTVGSATFTGYKTFAVKVIPLSTNSSVIPKIRELRAIALQV